MPSIEGGSQMPETRFTSENNLQSRQRSLTPDVVKKLSKKLSEIVGQDVDKDFNLSRNEMGEFVNEEGLPIIDITEPLTATTTQRTEDEVLIEDDILPPIATLPPLVRDRWRRKCDSILDQLEEEEQLEQAREEQKDLEEKQEILRKKKEVVISEKEKFKAARELQKKMGRALLRNMAAAREQEEADAKLIDVDQGMRKTSNDQTIKKTVTFADVPADNDDSDTKEPLVSQRILDWGDITPARLRSGASPLLSSEKHPMKIMVVERIPGAPTEDSAVPDSDDESDPGSHSSVDHDDFAHPPASDEDVEEEEFDLDVAQHQREIALQYHDKRQIFGEAVLTTIASDSRDSKDIQNVPPDVVSSDHDKSPISIFKAAHLASSYNAAISPSTSSGALAVPASTSRTLQKAIRTGKLDDNGRLVSEDTDSASDDENENMQEVLDLLRKGEAYNLGPDGNRIHAVLPLSSERERDLPSQTTSSSAESTTFNELPPIKRPKSSKFKLSRVMSERPPIRPPSPSSGHSTRTATPTSTMERSSPKLSSATLTNFQYTMPTVIDSPSFPPVEALRPPDPTTATPPPVVIDSPSFAKPTIPQASLTNTRLARPPIVMSSAVRESPRRPPNHDAENITARNKPEKVSRFMAERM